MNRKFWLGFVTVLVVMGFSTLAFAQGAPAEAAAATGKTELGKWLAVAAGFGIAIAAFGGALGQGRAAAAALDGIARNPGASGKLFVPMLLGLAFIESLVIYALIIAFMLVGKL